MTNKQHQLAVQEAVKGKFRGHQPLRSRSVPHYPDTAEREFKRVTNGYIRLLKKSLMEHLPSIIEEYRREQRNDSRLDASRNLEDKVRQELQKVAEELEQKLAAFGLDSLVKKIARLTKTNSLREWKRVCKDTLGIDLMDDYYSGDFYEEALRRWVDENVYTYIYYQTTRSVPCAKSFWTASGRAAPSRTSRRRSRRNTASPAARRRPWPVTRYPR